MNIATFVTHKVKFVSRYRHALAPMPRKPPTSITDICGHARAVNMGHGSDLRVTRPVDRRVIKNALREFGGRQRNVIAVVYRFASGLVISPNRRKSRILGDNLSSALLPASRTDPAVTKKRSHEEHCHRSGKSGYTVI
ncbi:hypothetical protein H9Q09_21535 [Aurantimonas sp. DM33-3]|nr:hypothetical protein [Aurantimonas sp. DM33-3]